MATVPTQITDKNGKRTTVHKKAEEAPKPSRELPIIRFGAAENTQPKNEELHIAYQEITSTAAAVLWSALYEVNDDGTETNPTWGDLADFGQSDENLDYVYDRYMIVGDDEMITALNAIESLAWAPGVNHDDKLPHRIGIIPIVRPDVDNSAYYEALGVNPNGDDAKEFGGDFYYCSECQRPWGMTKGKTAKCGHKNSSKAPIPVEDGRSEDSKGFFVAVDYVRDCGYELKGF